MDSSGALNTYFLLVGRYIYDRSDKNEWTESLN